MHHISDSHTHCYNQVRWTLTEDNPLIKAYDQDAFAQMYDYQKAPIAWSISHLEAIHQKMVYIFVIFLKMSGTEPSAIPKRVRKSL
ncbi:MAG: hypothetical protein H6583_03480 [Alteromonas sp.]|nr:hypothetical protein [Alteromonas sp.]